MGLSLDKANNSKALFKKDVIMLLEALKNAHILNKFYLEWARDYHKNCQRHPANLLAKQKKNFTPGLYETYAINYWLFF